MKKTKLLTLGLIMTVSVIQAQHKPPNQLELLGVNALFSGFTTGLGAVINKKKGSSTYKTFFNGFYKGAIGGGICFAGKSMNSLIQKNQLYYGWTARATNSLGMSVIENGIRNRQMLENIHMYLYLTRVDYNFKSNKFKARALPVTIVDFAYRSTKFNATLDLKTSLLMGSIVITKDHYVIEPVQEIETKGFSSFNNIYCSNDLDVEVLRMENTRVFQREHLNLFNAYVPTDVKYIYLENIAAQNLLYLTNKGIFDSEVELIK